MASYGLIIAQYQPKNQTVNFRFNFILPPSICTQAGSRSLRRGRMNPAGCGKLLNRTTAGWQTHALKPRQSTEWLHRLPGMQHIREANEGRMRSRGDGRMQHNTSGLAGGSSEGVTDAFTVCSHIKHVVRSEWPGAERQTRRKYCIWRERRQWDG